MPRDQFRPIATSVPPCPAVAGPGGRIPAFQAQLHPPPRPALRKSPVPAHVEIRRIEALLRQPSSPIPADLREAYNRHQYTHNRRFLLTIALLAYAAFYSYGLADWLVAPDISTLSLAARTAFVALSLPVTLALHRWCADVEWLDLIVPVNVLVATVIWYGLLARSAEPAVQTYQYAGLIFTMLAGVSVRVRFHTALPILLAIAAVTVAGVWQVGGRSLPALLMFLLVFLPVVFFSVIGCWATTLERRRDFLRNRIDEIRHAELQALLESERETRQQYLRFGALISHEFRNALSIIDSQLTVLRKEQARGTAQVERRVDAALGATHRLADLFNTWLQGDRLSQSLLRASPRMLRLKAWLVELLAKHRYITGEREVLLDCRVEMLRADPALLKLALVNLVENACKYSPAGTPLRIETRERPGAVGIAVSDRGIGIAAEHHAEVLKEYFRVAPEGPVRGVGLGLSIVQRVARLHEGEVEVTSTLGEGSTFCLWLAQGAEPAAAGGAASALAPAAGSAA